MVDTKKKKLEKQYKQQTKIQEKKGQQWGMVVMPHIPNFTPQFNRIARRHRVNAANKIENRFKDLVS